MKVGWDIGVFSCSYFWRDASGDGLLGEHLAIVVADGCTSIDVCSK